MPRKVIDIDGLTGDEIDVLTGEQIDSFSSTITSFSEHGREGIGITQPQSGTDYPLVTPSEDVRYLIADFYMSFDQPSDYGQAPPYALPFRIKWLFGFGDDEPEFDYPHYSSSSGSWWFHSVCSSISSSYSSSSAAIIRDCLPIPRNFHDIIIVDANDRVVFDSTNIDVEYHSREWGERLRIVQWEHPTDARITLVYHTAWDTDKDPQPISYPTYFFPEQAVLDLRAVERLPKRVRSFTVVLDNLRKTPVNFAAGYNMDLAVGETSEEQGERRQTRVVFNATPGAGYGVFPGCEPEPLVIRRLNGVSPTDDGDFFMAATDCYWVRQPTLLISNDPRTTLPTSAVSPGNIPEAGLPHNDAGTAKNLPGWPLNDDPAYAHLQFGNDCPPCCDCDEYVAVAQYMNRQRDRYHDLGVRFEDIRDVYHANRERWLASYDCFMKRPLRIRLLPQICPYMDVAIQFCNQTDQCHINLELSATFTTSPNGGMGIEVPGYTFITGARNQPGRASAMTERYQMGGSWPTFTAFFDAVNPGQSVYARFRLQFNNCGVTAGSSSASLQGGDVPYAVTGCLVGTVGGEPITAATGVIDGSVPAPVEVCETQALNCPATGNATTNLLLCACEK